MARGKHSTSKQGRDRRILMLDIAAAEADLAAERALLAEANVELAALEQAQSELSRASAERDAAVAPQTATLRRQIEVLERAAGEAEPAAHVAHRAWQRVFGLVVDTLGGGLQGLEAAARLVGVEGFVNDSPSSRLDTAGVVRIQRARGERPTTPTLDTEVGAGVPAHPGRALENWLRRPVREVYASCGMDLEHTVAPVAATDEDRALLAWADRSADSAARSQQAAVALDAVHAWHPFPFFVAESALDQAAGRETAEPVAGAEVLKALGASWPGTPSDITGARVDEDAEDDVSALQRRVPAHPSSALPATARSAVAAAGPAVTADSWREVFSAQGRAVATSSIPAPLASAPIFPRPSDAAAVKHWHTLASLGMWSRLVDGPDPVAARHPAAQRAGRVTAGLACAALYWLPPGQTRGYVDSLPLSDQDRDDLRLPFPQVLLVLADPLVLPAAGNTVSRGDQTAPGPLDTEPAEVEEEYQDDDDLVPYLGVSRAVAPYWQIATEQLQTELQGRPEVTLLDLATRWSQIGPDELPDVGEVLATTGATVEAILLLSDALGRPDDLFAWCLAIPGRSRAVLARVVVPARRSMTAYGPQIDNLAAVVAWADWHEPDLDHSSLSDTPRSSGTGKPPLGSTAVRVLDVRRTERHDSIPSVESTGRTVDPHLRRGHWRRQRHGVGLNQVRRIRIAPVVVNAGRGPLRTTVYRLPSPDRARRGPATPRD